MLVLSRKEREGIVIDLREFGLGLIELMTVEIRADKVRHGIEADKRIPVHRREVFELIESQKREEPAA